MKAKFVNVDRLTPMLLPQDLREWIPENDMVHFVIEAVEGMHLANLRVNHRGSGSAQYPPTMMMALLIYCYANGVFGSRRIEAATYRDIAVRYLSGDTHPDHDTICKFRRENFESVADCFVRVLEMAREMKMLKVGTVSVDGTHIRANASKDRNITYQRAGELIEQLDQEVRDLLEKAEAADRESKPTGQVLPQEIARREALKAKLAQARKRVEERVKRRAEAEKDEYEAKVAARNERKGRRKGKKIRPPEAEPSAKEQENFTDTDSRLMRKNKRSGYAQNYNAQAVVDADGSQLILASRVSQCASDRNELVEDVISIPKSLGTPGTVLADNGYASGDEVKTLEDNGMEVLVSVHAEAHHQRRKHDFRPSKVLKKPKEPKAPWLKAMKEKMETDEARAKYKLRMQTVEPVFGVIKQCMGFRQFLLRGVDKVEGEWQLVSLAYNFKRLWNIKAAAI